MCKHEMVDDRPSLVELAYLSDTHRWNFIFPPIELAALAEIIDRSVRFATITFPVADPHNDAVPVRDFELIAHLARKLFTLGICFDAINAHTNERVVLEDWLFKRLHDARNPAKARTRPRKPKLILADSNEGAFGCVCKTPPLDAPLVVRCNKCAQTYHMSCVRAPAEAHGADTKSWRCPCCSVKEGKHYSRAIEVRVQMQGESSRVGVASHLTGVDVELESC
jgi:histone demethylase JARID1